MNYTKYFIIYLLHNINSIFNKVNVYKLLYWEIINIKITMSNDDTKEQIIKLIIDDDVQSLIHLYYNGTLLVSDIHLENYHLIAYTKRKIKVFNWFKSVLLDFSLYNISIFSTTLRYQIEKILLIDFLLQYTNLTDRDIMINFPKWRCMYYMAITTIISTTLPNDVSNIITDYLAVDRKFNQQVISKVLKLRRQGGYYCIHYKGVEELHLR